MRNVILVLCVSCAGFATTIAVFFSYVIVFYGFDVFPAILWQKQEDDPLFEALMVCLVLVLAPAAALGAELAKLLQKNLGLVKEN